jgi:hypothetical protein
VRRKEVGDGSFHEVQRSLRLCYSVEGRWGMKAAKLFFWLIMLSTCAASACATSRNLAENSSKPETHFSKGMWEISVGGTAGVHSTSNDLVKRSVDVGFSPSYGYFLTRNLEILGAVGVDYKRTDYNATGTPLEIDYSKEEDYSIAAGVQYNLETAGDAVPFGKMYLGMVNARRAVVQRNIPVIGIASDKRKATDLYFGFRAGIRYFVAKNITCDMGLGWKRILFEKDFGGATDDYSLVIGCAFFF